MQHQLDHIIISWSDLKRFTDAGGCGGQLIDSDHRAVKCKLRFAVRLRRKCDPRARVTKLDYSPLLDNDIKASFADKVVATLPPAAATSYSTLATALRDTAIATLPKRGRPTPRWFAARETRLLDVIGSRNCAFHAHQREPTSATRMEYSKARAVAQREVRLAKSAWIVEQCTIGNDGFNGATGGKATWDTVKVLKAGLAPPRRAPQAKMKRPDGSVASSAEEIIAEVFAEHFTDLYGRTPQFDESVLDTVPEALVVSNEEPPSDMEIRKAVGKLRPTAPGASGIHARLWKALASTDDGFNLYIQRCVLAFWESEQVPAEWETGLLSILPKKGDLSKPGNYRGIMMLEVFYKIVGNIILSRLQPIKEDHLDHENQNGFRPRRGCFDSIFTVKQVMKKRREHSCETWILLIDLVKAFDRVPRELLWLTMGKQGVPPKLIQLLRMLHENVKVQFEVDGATKVIDSIIGVKQGDLLGPELFTFFMEAVMKTWRSEHREEYEPCLFRTKPDLKLTSRTYTTRGEEFSVLDSEYADDTAVIFSSREDTERMTPKLINHFARWGMEVHVGSTANATSKSEILFCAATPAAYKERATYDGADLSDIHMSGQRFMPVVNTFKYLGSYLSRDCSDSHDVNSRIESAGKAFGAQRKCLFAADSVSLAAKRVVYTGVILAILLYGCECWSLTETLYTRLRLFHAQSVRVMARVTRKDVWRRRISTTKLLTELDMLPIDYYIARRQLGWLGHVARMDMQRLPRRMLSSWTPHRRPVGSPTMTYGRAMKKALQCFGLEDSWETVVQHRELWRQALSTENFRARMQRSRQRPATGHF